MILGREKGAEVMVEPPGDAVRRGIFEVDDGILIAGKIRFIKEGSSAVDQAVITVGSILRDAFAMKAREERRGAGSVETLVVIEDSDVQKVGAPA